MKQLKIFFILFIIAGALYFFFGNGESGMTELKEQYLSNNKSDDDEQKDSEEDEVDAKQQLVKGSLVVDISVETQGLAGIETALTEKVDVQSENKAFATVVDIKELLDLRSQFRNVEAEQEIINTEFKNSARLLEQLKVLHKETTNISTRELQQARSKWEEDRARIHATDIKLENIRNKMVQNWNTELTQLALQEDSEIFERLINREEYLILVSLKGEQQLSPDTKFVFVNRTDNRKQAREANFVSSAPFSDNNLQGETYFFRTHADSFRIGMRLYVWLPGTGYSGEGINIPDEAVVWYAGKPWAYVQVDDELFSRRSLLDPIKTDTGWLVKENFNANEKIVISGAQTLLSEEFKWAIPDEDDD